MSPTPNQWQSVTAFLRAGDTDLHEHSMAEAAVVSRPCHHQTEGPAVLIQQVHGRGEPEWLTAAAAHFQRQPLLGKPYELALRERDRDGKV